MSYQIDSSLGIDTSLVLSDRAMYLDVFSAKSVKRSIPVKLLLISSKSLIPILSFISSVVFLNSPSALPIVLANSGSFLGPENNQGNHQDDQQIRPCKHKPSLLKKPPVGVIVNLFQNTQLERGRRLFTQKATTNRFTLKPE